MRIPEPAADAMVCESVKEGSFDDDVATVKGELGSPSSVSAHPKSEHRSEKKKHKKKSKKKGDKVSCE